MAIVYNADGEAGKVCTKCKLWKPTAAFAVLNMHGKPQGDGYRSRCKICSNEDKREKWAANPELFRMKARQYMEQRRETTNEYQRQWRVTNSDKVKTSLAGYRARNIGRKSDNDATSGIVPRGHTQMQSGKPSKHITTTPAYVVVNKSLLLSSRVIMWFRSRRAEATG